MKRDDMIKRLEAGEKAIDLSIEKWKDILDGTGIDDGGENCACCYVDDIAGGNYECFTCPIAGYDREQRELHVSSKKYDDAFLCRFCNNLPAETDKEGIKKAIEYMERVKKWMANK